MSMLRRRLNRLESVSAAGSGVILVVGVRPHHNSQDVDDCLSSLEITPGPRDVVIEVVRRFDALISSIPPETPSLLRKMQRIGQ